jgi:hypothetical protein
MLEYWTERAPLLFCRVVQSYVDNLILLAGGSMAFCGAWTDGPIFLQSLGHT